jgi:ribosome maturation factor RimP
MITKEKIEALVKEKIEGTPLFLVDIKVSPANKIEVFIDGDAGLAISDCVDVSRHVEKNLDREIEDFSLEVSSPGATAPLTTARQYKKHLGRELEVSLMNGEVIVGKLVDLNVNGKEEISIETTTREQKPIGKGKVTVTRTHIFDLKNIKESKVKLKF